MAVGGILSGVKQPLPEVPGFILRPATIFIMGDAKLNRRCGDCPPHQVTLSPHGVAETAVTVGQFKRFAQEISGQPTLALQVTIGGALPETVDTANDKTVLEERLSTHVARFAGRLESGVRFAIVPNPASLGKMPDLSDLPAEYAREDHPIVRVSHEEAVAYCAWHTGVVRALTGRNDVIARLLTEAEWECAATSGGKQPYATTSGRLRRSEARYGLSWKTGTTGPVREFPPSEGKYGMTGNVWEWCADAYDANAYVKFDQQDPVNVVGATWVVRGGAFSNVDNDRLPARYRGFSLVGHSERIGLRVELAAAQDSQP